MGAGQALSSQPQTHAQVQAQAQVRAQAPTEGQTQRQPASAAAAAAAAAAPAMNPSSSFTFENFHLDPEDFQNFLLINPPLTEYSSHYYMNLSNSGTASNANANAHGVAASAGATGGHLGHGGHGGRSLGTNAITDSVPATNTPMRSLSGIPDSDQLLNQLSLKKQIPVSVAPLTEQLSSVAPTSQMTFPPFTGDDNDAIRNAAAGATLLPTNNTNTNTNTANATAASLSGISFPSNAHALASQSTQAAQQSAALFSNQYAFDADVRFDDQQLPLPTRRLSISNGQIGQISRMVHSQMYPSSTSNSSGTPNSNDSTAVSNHSSGSARQPQKAQQKALLDEEESIEVDTNGVPTRELLYNNEVIFNPNGPIPGTNAWKRAKILERNRIAASKCRAKKKNLQKKLQQDVDKLSEENSRLRDMMTEMKKRVERYCQKNNIDIAEVYASDSQLKKEQQEEEMLKKKKAQNTSELVDTFLKENVL